MAKVLLVDTNFSSAPLFSELERLGHEVHVVSRSTNDCLTKISKNFWLIDYSDTVELKNLLKSEKFDYIIPGCTDLSYTSCSTINDGQFPGIETPEIERLLNNKESFRKIASSLRLPTPAVQEYSETGLKWPVIVKPVDSYSGKGITVIEKEDKTLLMGAISLACEVSSSKKYLIEDYIKGQLYSHSAFIEKKNIVADFIVQEDCSINPFVVDTSRVISNPNSRIQTQMRDAIEKLAVALSLKDGLVHTQFIDDGKNVWLIEITRRCPGDLYSQLIELSTGFPYAKAYIAGFLGGGILGKITTRENAEIIRHTITVSDEQFFSHIKFNKSAYVERFTILNVSGDLLQRSPLSRVGILFLKAHSETESELVYQALLSRRMYDVVEL
jgi:biotin carboxylase